MAQKYPLFVKDQNTLTVITSPISAIQYRNTDNVAEKANGFELYFFTNRKTIRRLQRQPVTLSAEQFASSLQGSLTEKLKGCFAHCLMFMNEADKAAFQSHLSSISLSN